MTISTEDLLKNHWPFGAPGFFTRDGSYGYLCCSMDSEEDIATWEQWRKATCALVAVGFFTMKVKRCDRIRARVRHRVWELKKYYAFAGHSAKALKSARRRIARYELLECRLLLAVKPIETSAAVWAEWGWAEWGGI